MSGSFDFSKVIELLTRLSITDSKSLMNNVDNGLRLMSCKLDGGSIERWRVITLVKQETQLKPRLESPTTPEFALTVLKRTSSNSLKTLRNVDKIEK